MVVAVLVDRGGKGLHTLDLAIQLFSFFGEADDAFFAFPDKELHMVAGDFFFNFLCAVR
ncbi:MAG: hypothetical protein Q4D81_09040 [Eubacteriales bacterium]|nr:hypothetical protein [Eubacteriales bacterium]